MEREETTRRLRNALNEVYSASKNLEAAKRRMDQANAALRSTAGYVASMNCECKGRECEKCTPPIGGTNHG